MSGKLNIYSIGAGGVNLTKAPFELADDEVTQTQNGELIPDINVGGQAVLSKRGGLATLTSSALAGSVQGIWGLPLLTTYTRTLYFSRGDETGDSDAADTFYITTDGSTFTPIATPLEHCSQANWSDEDGLRNAHRMASFKTFIAYPGNNYSKGTDDPEIDIWDGATASLVERISIGPSANGVAYCITDMLTANGVIYIGVHDPGGVSTNLAGRVMRYDLTTGELSQVLTPFGNETGDATVGYPSALCWYQDQLYVGLNNGATTDGIGKVVRAYPDVDTAWTTDVSNLRSSITSIFPFLGDLYVATQSSVSAAARIYKRAATTQAYTAAYTSAHPGQNSFLGCLIVYGSNLYAAEYDAGGNSDVLVLQIIKTADGSSWSTDVDVAAADSGVNDNLPTNAILYGSDLYYVFRATAHNNADGMVMRLHSGTWSRAFVGNLNGNAAVLVTRT